MIVVDGNEWKIVLQYLKTFHLVMYNNKVLAFKLLRIFDTQYKLEQTFNEFSLDSGVSLLNSLY